MENYSEKFPQQIVTLAEVKQQLTVYRDWLNDQLSKHDQNLLKLLSLAEAKEKIKQLKELECRAGLTLAERNSLYQELGLPIGEW